MSPATSPVIITGQFSANLTIVFEGYRGAYGSILGVKGSSILFFVKSHNSSRPFNYKFDLIPSLQTEANNVEHTGDQSISITSSKRSRD